MNKNLFIIVVILGIIVYACSDIFEENIENEEVILLAPTNNLATSIRAHTFWWEKVGDALKYNLQIVSPSFDSIIRLELDSNVTSNMFEYQLNPGKYQWRVKAFNGSSETAYSVFSIKIDSTLSLNGQKVTLKTPANESALNTIKVLFSWEKWDIANGYKIIIKKGQWSDGDVIYTKDTTATSLEYELSEGEFAWGIQAYNDDSYSTTTTRSFVIDITKPKAPKLVSPDPNFESTSNTVTFTWESSENNDSILIGTDTTFNDIVKERVSNKRYEITFENGTKVRYWKVSTTDNAGNWSGYSERRKFTLKNAK